MENSEAIYQNDSVLIPFLTSGEENGAESALSGIILQHIQPTIERNLRAKMHVSLSPEDFSQANQEALEIVGEAKLLLVAELRKLKTDSSGKSIQNLQNYVVSVTVNAYREYLRKKYPLRNQLKNKLNYLLKHHPDFELRENEKGRFCGLKNFADTTAPPLDLEKIKAAIEAQPGYLNLTVSAHTIELVRRIFAAAEAPLFFNDLLTLVAEIQGVRDKPEISEDEALSFYEKNLAAESSALNELEEKEILGRIWTEIAALPVRHRIAFLLNLKDKKGDCVITLFPILRIASVRQIAQALEFSAEEFAGVWNELPWDDLKIAEYLGLTRQQVINLRHSARARLVRLIRK